jgi:hypothetical protein
VATLLGLSSPLTGLAQTATTWTVNSCSEANSGSGTVGTLRYAAQYAVSGDTIDLSELTCSTISLHSGAVALPQDEITLGGPGASALTITGMYNGTQEHDRIFKHTGNSYLVIAGMTISDGYVINLAYQGAAYGGCIYSAGTAVLLSATVQNCSTHIDNGFSEGGGIFAKQGIELKYSLITNNVATGILYASDGGGAYTPGRFYAKYSTISGNVATTERFQEGYGGGVRAGGNMLIQSSTIVGNYAGTSFGGIDSYNRYGYAPFTTTIANSTISGNSAGYFVGGFYSNLGKIHVYNSTIALNHQGKTDYADIAAGMFVQNFRGVPAVTLISTLIAGNTAGGNASDFSIRTNGTLTGSNNLVTSSNVTMPADTLTACPLLGPLRDNGGPTLTHALLSGSPGIDKGLNPNNYVEDQRGDGSDLPPYPYPRISGSAADVGAYEVRQDDIIFNTSFEGCP